MRYVGVDLAASGVRVAEVTPRIKDGFVAVKNAAIHRYPIDGSPIGPGGTVKNPAQVGDALRTLLRAHKFPTRKIVVAQRVGVGTEIVTVPATMKPSEYEQALRRLPMHLWSEGTEFDPKTARLSWKRITRFTDGTGVDRDMLAVTAVRPDSIAMLEEVLDLAKVDPLAVDIEAACLIRSCLRSHPDATQVVTLVDIGAETTTVVTVRGQFPRSTIVLPTGGRHITDALQAVMGTDFAEAEERKRYLAVDKDLDADPTAAISRFDLGPSLSPVEDELIGSTDQLISEISSAIAYDASLYPSAPTTLVSLIGGASLLPGFRRRIQSTLGLPVTYAQPWVSASSNRVAHEITGGAVSVKDQRRTLATLSVAIGAAMWGLQDERPEMDSQ